jgi:1,2-diacylglycerol 3-alpha-glucosyltransferase
VRIGLVSDCYHPTPNGVTGVVALLREGLEARGHHVVLTAPRVPRRAAGRHGAERELDGFPPVDDARPSLPLLPSVRLRVAPATARSMRRLMERERLDLVHTHTEGPLGLAARNAAVAAGIPAVHTLHTFYGHYLHYARLDALAPRVAERGLRRALGWFLGPYDRTVAPSATAHAHLRDLAPRGRPVLIPNGVEIAGSLRTVDRAALAARLGLVEGERLLLAVGRIGPEKRSRELVDALARQLHARGDVRALLVGGGRQLEDLRRRVARAGLGDRILLPGYLPHRDVLALYDMAAVLLTASVSENHPLSLLEAAAAGLPLVVRADANLGTLVEDGRTGIVARSDEELAARSIVLLDDPARRARLGAGARQLARTFSAEAHVDRTEELYRELLGCAPSTRSGSASARHIVRA